jgi:hypothetical protein
MLVREGAFRQATNVLDSIDACLLWKKIYLKKGVVGHVLVMNLKD